MNRYEKNMAGDDKFLQELEYAKDVVKKIQSDKRSYIRYTQDIRPVVNLKHMLETSAEIFSDNVVIYEKNEGDREYKPMKYRHLLAEVNALGTALMELGLQGEKVALIGNNSSKWARSYLSVICGVGVVVPLDKELPENMLLDLIKRSGAKAVIFDDRFEDTFKAALEEDNNLEYVINMDLDSDREGVLSWETLKTKGYELLAIGNTDFLNAKIDRDVLACLLFTSGTTGLSKGVMLSHGNIVENLMPMRSLIKISDKDIFFSVLPVHHTYECTCGFLIPIYLGASIAYCQGLKYIAKNLQEVKPTIILGVPAIFESLNKKIWQGVRKKGKEKLLKRVIKINNVTKKVGLNLGNKFFKDITDIFGGRLRMVISGGAAIQPSVLENFRDFGLVAFQGYGLTECAPIASINPYDAPRDSSIGVVLPGTEMIIDDKNADGIGELCYKGKNVMLGYYEMPEQTREVLVDGYFRTGDLGYVDKDGYFYISGRKKNVIITSNGENVFPEEIEYILSLDKRIQESMVYQTESEGKKDFIIAASISMDMEYIDEIYGDISDDRLTEIAWDIVDQYNENSPAYRQIRRINVRREELKKNTSRKVIRFDESNK
ncbi:MAG: AMP-binding protein [Eubacteriales bacterium]|nr:AMP-binding protein [Eubacteriales bacterium]MDY3332511.1 AMP-binding protein [Gallibacter sp.]